MLFDMRADEEAAFLAAKTELSELEQRLLGHATRSAASKSASR